MADDLTLERMDELSRRFAAKPEDGIALFVPYSQLDALARDLDEARDAFEGLLGDVYGEPDAGSVKAALNYWKRRGKWPK